MPNPRAAIALAAVPAPHPGTSYNPPEAAHTELLRAAHEAELRRVQEAEALEATKVRILGARQVDDGSGDGGAQGMLIDKPGANPSQDELGQGDPDSAGLGSVDSAKESAMKRKTKQQRRKAQKLRAEVRRQPPTPPFLCVCEQRTISSHM